MRLGAFILLVMIKEVFQNQHFCLYKYQYVCTLRVKKYTLNSRVLLLSSFAASIGLMHCVVHSRAHVLLFYVDHDCSGEGRLAARTTTQRFSRPMPAAPRTKLWLLFVLCTQMAVYKLFDTWIVRTWAYAMFLHEFIWTAATVLFAQVWTGLF